MDDGEPRPVVFADARVIDPSRGFDGRGAVIVADGRILAAGPEALGQGAPEGAEIVECAGRVVAPGLVDMCVFVGEPGFAHRETFASASAAAARGGVTTIVPMPDTDPVIDDPALVDYVFRRARDTACVRVAPMAAITRGLAGREIAEIGLLQEDGAIGFTDGRRAVADSGVMRRALTYARGFDALLAHHPQDPALVGGGVMNEGEAATRLGLPGIPHEAEHIMLERDIRLARLTGARYHAAALSSAGSVPIIARAKDAGLDVSAAVTINHLCLNEIDIGNYRTFFKLSPPLRGEDDRQALAAALGDGTIDIIVSRHDPQDAETKRHPFAEAADGAIGLETLLAAALRLVHSGDVPLVRLIEALSTAPARRLRLEAGTLAPGASADLVLFDPDEPWIVTEDALVSRSKNTPFEDARFSGRVLRTLVAGRTVFAHAPPAEAH